MRWRCWLNNTMCTEQWLGVDYLCGPNESFRSHYNLSLESQLPVDEKIYQLSARTTVRFSTSYLAWSNTTLSKSHIKFLWGVSSPDEGETQPLALVTIGQWPGLWMVEVGWLWGWIDGWMDRLQSCGYYQSFINILFAFRLSIIDGGVAFMWQNDHN